MLNFPDFSYCRNKFCGQLCGHAHTNSPDGLSNQASSRAVVSMTHLKGGDVDGVGSVKKKSIGM
jgi:hypothetical protein